jgi:PKHD-type hydroxylase
MFLTIANVLSRDDVAMLCALLDELAFVDGRATAGWSARLAKENRQAAAGAALSAVQARVEAALLNNPVFAMATRPKRLTPLMFARYGPNETYGTHVDDALMHGHRSDVSFTLFLSEPDSYDGGELVIETAASEDAVKLPAGSLYVYPASTLHRVEPVTRGERVVCVGWARSYLRSAEQRELLFDLDTARRNLFSREGASADFLLLSKCAANLLRMWADD